MLQTRESNTRVPGSSHVISIVTVGNLEPGEIELFQQETVLFTLTQA